MNKLFKLKKNNNYLNRLLSSAVFVVDFIFLFRHSGNDQLEQVNELTTVNWTQVSRVQSRLIILL